MKCSGHVLTDTQGRLSGKLSRKGPENEGHRAQMWAQAQRTPQPPARLAGGYTCSH